MTSADGPPATYIENDFVQDPPSEKLPVPSLSQTMQRYLAAIEAVVSAEELARAKEQVREFASPGGLGQQLQKKLQDRAEALENWVYDWWLDDMYLNNRMALPVNSNPGMVFPNQKFNNQDDQLRFAAKMALGILDFKRMLDSGSLTVDMGGGKKPFPMCMAQYYRLLSSYRRPAFPKDILVVTEARPVSGDYHMIVAYKNQFYVMPVFRNFERISEQELIQGYRSIIRSVDQSKTNDLPIGLLTAEHRDDWAKAHGIMRKDITNQKSFDMIEQALAIICLDQPLPTSFNLETSNSKDRDENNKAHQMLHGGGSKYNSGNRWFDKTLQIVVGMDGVCGLCYEHSPAEGIVVIQLLENLLQADDTGEVNGESKSKEFLPEKLHWKTEQVEIRKAIETASKNIDKYAKELDFYVYRFDEYGREFPKSVKCSPDAFIQVALQLTYYKTHGKLVFTYESAGTRRFRFGRVDNIRAATADTLAWAESMTGHNKVNDEEKIKLFRKAMETQTEIMISNVSGQGIDCHLLGLRELCKDLKQPLPALFLDECYTTFNQFQLSTSQVPTQTDSFMGYGPVTPNGYGCSYNPHKDSIVFCISSFRSDPSTDSEAFAKHLGDSLREIKELLTSQRSGAPTTKTRE